MADVRTGAISCGAASMVAARTAMSLTGAVPSMPAKPTDHRDAMAVDVYNAKLATYNAHVHNYVVCVNNYVRNADNDMDVIRKKSRDAVEEANR